MVEMSLLSQTQPFLPNEPQWAVDHGRCPTRIVLRELSVAGKGIVSLMDVYSIITVYHGSGTA